MHSAGQAWVEATNRAHDVDALEVLRAIVLEDGGVLHRILVRTRSSVDIARARVPWSGWITMVVGDLAFADNDMVRQHSAHCFVETAADSFLRHFEVRPRRG